MQDTILYIDDDAINLENLKLIYDKKFNVLTARNTSEAEILLKKNEVKLIITDQKMPDETGIGFINRIKTDYPDIVFIVLTGYTDTEIVLDALNSDVHRFIYKPFQEEELLKAMLNGLEKYNLKRHNMELLSELTEKNKELESSNDDFLRLALKHRNDKRTAEDNQKLLDAIFKNLPLVIILVDPERRILKINKTGQELTNKKEGDIVGLKLGQVFDCVNFDKKGQHGISEECYTCFMSNTIKNSFAYKTDYYKVKATIPTIIEQRIEERTVLVSTTYIDGMKPMVLISLDGINESKEIVALR